MKAVVIVLAAGKARSVAHHKALIEHEGGKSFLQSLASTFGKAGCAVVAVVGHEAAAVREQHPTLHLVDSEHWERGLFSSVRAGVDAALEEGADVVLLHPVDMPAVRATTLKTLLKLMGESVEGLRPEFDGAPGWPLVLSRATAERLRELGASHEDFEGAVRGLQLRRIAVKDPGVIVNINSPETYERLFGSAPKLAPPPKRRGKKSEASTAAPPAPLDEDGLSGS
jgi:molybdenum cofactor cytidylyltransferase